MLVIDFITSKKGWYCSFVCCGFCVYLVVGGGIDSYIMSKGAQISVKEYAERMRSALSGS